MKGLMLCLMFFLLSFGLTAVLCRVILPVLRKKHAGQYILEIGPSWHLSKAGTPTMGGLSFLLPILLLSAGGAVYLWQTGERGTALSLLLIAFYGALCGGIGCLDDLAKLRHRQNAGLSAAQKYFLQLLASAVFLAAAELLLHLGTAIRLPFSGRSPELGFYYYPLALLFLTGMMNACNLTDGVDGLLSSVVLVVACFIFLLGGRSDNGVLSLTGALLSGAAFGFLLWNAHPAKVFMGDTGSLFFGGVLAAVGIVSGEALLFLIFGIMPVIETASVILQVAFFRLTHGKRLFKMAPFHHHLEKCGLSEEAVVGIFSLVTLIACSLGVIFWRG